MRRQRRARRLRLTQHQPAVAEWHYEVDFQPLLIAKVVELTSLATAELGLGDLAGDEALEHSAEER